MSKIGRGSGVSGSGSSIAEDMYFSTLAERDAFTTENPNRITQGVTCAVVSGDNYDYFQYDTANSLWRDANLIFQGLRGAQGVPGADGVGVVAGGTTGQVLAKKSNDDHDTEWVNQSGGGGVTEHNLLANRDAVDQHPIAAISGLAEELSQKVDKEVGKGLSEANFTQVEKDKLSGVEDQATKNQTDEFLLNRNNHTGSISIATVDNLQSALDDKVSSSDSRLTDAREWIADEASLEEAQARTSGTFKKWSALRVGQAIVAWWEATGNQDTLDDLISSGDLADALASKVDKVAGFGLSQANFTQAEKDKLATLEDSKFKGLHEDLPALQIAYPVADAGSYAFVDGKAGNPNQLYMWSTDGWEIVGGEAVSLTPAQVKQLLLENADTNNFSDSDKQRLQDAVTQSELASVLTGYAQVVHSHTISQVTGLRDELDSKAASDHGHAIANVTGLQAELDSKVDKVTGKGLSTNDYDDDAKEKVDGMGTAASLSATTSRGDSTLGRALKVGDHGFGVSRPLPSGVDFHDLDYGDYSGSVGSVVNGPSGATFFGVVSVRNRFDMEDRKVITASLISGINTSRSWIKYQTVDGWTPWHLQYDSSSLFITQTPTDTTSNRLLKVGDFGVGTNLGSPSVSRDSNSNQQSLATGIYSTFSSGDYPAVGALINAKRASTQGGQILLSARFDTPSAGSQFTGMWHRATGVDDNGPWARVYDSVNLGESDTSWKTVNQLDNGWTGIIRYIKRGGMVTVVIDAIDGTAATSNNIFALPVGYRPQATVRCVFSRGDANFNRGYVEPDVTGMLAIAGERGAVHQGSVTYPVIP